MVDTDGSETITDITISNVPDGATLSAGADNGDGSWTLQPEDLNGLQIELDGLGNEDFDLEVKITTADGLSESVTSETISVELEHDTLEQVFAQQYEDQLSADADDVVDSEQIHSTEEEKSLDQDIAEFEATFNEINSLTQELQDAGRQAFWDEPENPGFDTNEFSDDSNSEHADVDSSDPSSDINFDVVDFPVPNQLQSSEVEVVDNNDLVDVPIDVSGIDELDDSVDVASLSTTALLLLCTRRDETRKQLIKLQKERKENLKEGEEN